MIYNGNSPWLDRSQKLSSRFDQFLTPIAENIVKKAGKRRKEDAVQNVKTALSVILANVLRSHALHPTYGVRIDLSNDGYPEGPFNPRRLGIRSVRKVVNYLANSNPQLIHKKGGNRDKVRGFQYPTEIWISDFLKDAILTHMAQEKSTSINPSNSYSLPITRNTFGIDDYTSRYYMIFERMDLPSIRLRKGSSKSDGRFMDFEHNEETRSMETRLARYNSFMSSNAKTNLFLDDKSMVELQKSRDHNYEEFGRSDSEPPSADLAAPTRLYRVFNQGRFDHGGRFYGGWWQSIPGRYRRFITINGTPTVEVDFSGIQVAMLYAMIGQQLEGDAYAIEGFGPEFRRVVKTATLAMINAKGRIEPPHKSDLPPSVTWNDLREAIMAKHKPIAKFFGSGEGIRLQRLDSDIAADVMIRMIEKGIPVLPIHDSFIVAEGHDNELSEIMLSAYRQRMAGRTISLKRSPALLDDLLTGYPNLIPSKRHSLGMKLFLARKESPDYIGYRRREELLAESLGDRLLTIKATRPQRDAPKGQITGTGPMAAFLQFASKGIPQPLSRLWDWCLRT
ncbi:hypothetical protein [Mesorhizobium sp. M0488]|uniref:hypothetical protein n=1 Tax=unclassified Mesorhizobium TaxID=325217 RepID=UPI0033382D17